VSGDGTQRWLIVLNDMRLSLGTRLGRTQDGFGDAAEGLDPDHPEYGAQTVFHWLGAVQENLLDHVMD
jgi:hypothetical protein